MDQGKHQDQQIMSSEKKDTKENIKVTAASEKPAEKSENGKAVKEKPAKEKPVKEKPVKEKPAKEKPVKEKPVKEKPVKKKKRNRDKELTIILSAILAALTIAGLILFFIMPDPYAGIPEQEEVSDLPTQEPEVPEPETDPVPIPVQPAISYPAPAYDFTEENVYVEIPGIDHEYTIAWVSDVHMITDFTAGDVGEASLETVRNRYETLSITPDGVHGRELWPMIIDYLNYNDFDAVIFGGDIIDYCSTSNMEALKRGFDRLKYPSDRILYIRADHDYGTWYSDGSTGFDDLKCAELHTALDGDDNTCKYIDFGDLIIAGVNLSTSAPGEDQIEVLTGLYGRGVPVIAATHVPYFSMVDPSLEELSMLVRNRKYYWNPGGDSYGIDENTRKILDLVYAEDSECRLVLAGHLHAAWEGEINFGLRQHIFSPAFSGVIGVVHVVPEGSAP
jgi:hypothetical protein